MVIPKNPDDLLVAIVGATGMKGGNVIDALAASPQSYRLRGLSHNPAKPEAHSLADRGVEVVSCEITLNNTDGVKAAFQGTSYIFVMTNYWEHMDHVREEAEGKLMVDCANQIDVKLLLLSSLVSVTEASSGTLTKVYHFDAKAAISKHARSIGVPFVEIQAAGYMSNIIDAIHPADVNLYSFECTWSPDCKIPHIDIRHDFGLFVQLAIESEEFKKGDGQIVFAYCEWISMREQAEILSRVTGKKVTYKQVTEDEYRSVLKQINMPPHIIDGIIEMSNFHEHIWKSVFVESSRASLARQPRSFEDYCRAKDWSSVFT
ncbi:hypothetical protein FDECE_2272 [Fusarium decemcellulare]|nr:hypothetical protein FDECE_2272 [Fusarium decemcellulare]